MSGVALPIIPKRQVDFSGLPVGGSQEVILADRVELLHWRELTLVVRVHSHSLTNGNNITVNIYAQSFTGEDPGLSFIGAPQTGSPIGPLTPVPALLTTNIVTSGSNAVANMVRVVAFGSRVGTGAMTATLTVAFVSKDV